MFYTLGYAESYEEALKVGRTWKLKGGWALPIEKAMQYRDRLLVDGLFAKELGLPKGIYNIYELPECTPAIVEGEVLKEKTIIGNKVPNEDQAIRGRL